MKIDPSAGQKIQPSQKINIISLIAAYYTNKPDPDIEQQRVLFGTSGHRGSSFDGSFNEAHILAITQAICLYRQANKIDGPLFVGIDTHALSAPAQTTVVEVLIANNVQTHLSTYDAFVPTPAISLAILNHNRSKTTGLADGIVITPSHNPPHQGGIKYNSIQGGPAELSATRWIEEKANELIKGACRDVKRTPYELALRSPFLRRHDYLKEYVENLVEVLDMEAIRSSGVSVAVDPLGGAGVQYWQAIAEKYRISLKVLNPIVDPTFSFMRADWDGQIRMDPSSPYAMQGVLENKNFCDITLACDTDHDRHGIVTRTRGLLPPNHYLSAAAYYLLHHRPLWKNSSRIGKTFVTSRMIDRIAEKAGRSVYETPVGFKWFVEGLFDGSLPFVCEESAGAALNRLDGSVWTTDKDGIAMGLLAAEIAAKGGQDPGELYQSLTAQFGPFYYNRSEGVADLQARKALKGLSPERIKISQLAGDPIVKVLSRARGNNAALEGILVETERGWFAARPSGTEEIYKIYGESFVSEAHLATIHGEAQAIVNAALQ